MIILFSLSAFLEALVYFCSGPKSQDKEVFLHNSWRGFDFLINRHTTMFFFHSGLECEYDSCHFVTMRIMERKL